MENILEDLLNEERDLQFNSFNEDTAWEVGNLLVDIAQKENLPIAIDITFAGRKLFHVSCPGAKMDNDEWIKRKNRLVYRFGHSSYYMGQLLKENGWNIEERYLLSAKEFAPYGGCFPVIIKGSGMVGTITVSGLKQEEDHQLVVRVLRSYLKK